MKRYFKLLIPFIVIALSSLSCAGKKPAEIPPKEVDETDAQPVHIQLSAGTTDLLIQEMRELQEGMKKIVPALVAEQWQEIAYIGSQMRDSYIMKDSLTKAQLHELHESLPAAFQELDHSFHESAGLLAQAAENQNYEQVSYYYYKLTEACVECHTIYATHTFPEFLKTKNP